MPAVLVTGLSRKAGIAAAVAAALRRDDWTVFGTGWRPFDATESWGSRPEDVDELLRDGVVAGWHEADLTAPATGAAIVDAAEAAAGPLTALVMCHTHSSQAGLLETTADDFDRHMAVNARSTLLLSAEFARRFRGEHGSGRIVNFTSSAIIGEFGYGASKAAVERITLGAAYELAPRGITVNAVEPGPTDTGWMSPDLYERIRESVPLGRVGLPTDPAELVSFLCSPRGGWITGQVIYCDGGASLPHVIRRGRQPL